MKANKLFNPLGDDKATRMIWGGNTTNLIQLNDITYKWALTLYRTMRQQFWIPQNFDIIPATTEYKKLTPDEQKAFDGILSYLTFLDSIQTANLPYIKSPITAPEISLCIAEQISQEAMHNESYQYIIETIIPLEQRPQIYSLWENDEILRDRCEYIASIYQDYVDNPSDFNYFRSLVADYLLEGIYFYNGFVFFYSLASRNLMSSVADIFRTINRDEMNHVFLYQKLLIAALDGQINLPYDEMIEVVYELTRTAVEHEIRWTNHILGSRILGITPHSTTQYTQYLADLRLRAIGLNPWYNQPKNPYKHLESIADTGDKATTKVNFFESGITSYMQSSAVGGWNF